MNKADRRRLEDYRVLVHEKQDDCFICFFVRLIDKQEKRIQDLEEAYDDAFPYGWGGT